MLLLSSLRVSDPDLVNYKTYFDSCLSSQEFDFELGYVLINKYFRSVTDNYYVMQFVLSFFSSWVIFSWFYKKSNNPIFTLLIYFLLGHFLHIHMAIQRQEIAMAIIILGMRFVEQKKLLPWILTIVLAMQFHLTAIVALPLYFTTGYTMSKRNALIVSVCVVIVALFGGTVMRMFLQLVSQTSFLPDRVYGLINLYLAQPVEYNTGLGILSVYLFYFLVILLYDSAQDKYMTNFIIALVCVSIGCHVSVFSRLQLYYLVCGGGFTAYNLLNRKQLPARFTFGKQSNRCCCFILLGTFILYSFLLYFVTMEYRTVEGILNKERWKYEAVIFKNWE